MDFFLFTLPLGAGVGIFGTLVGIGGGLILVPLFILCLPSTFPEAPQVIGTSLFVALNALSGTFAYIRQRRVFLKLLFPLLLPLCRELSSALMLPIFLSVTPLNLLLAVFYC